MSSVVISGDTSGAITLAAPAVAGTNTITLPASAGTMITTGSPQSGGVIQVVNVAYSTIASNSTSTFADTGLTASITPKFATSKILVLVDQNGVGKTSANAGNGVDIKLLRNGSQIVYMNYYATYTGTGIVNNVGSVSTNYLDSPATTSATTYKTQFMNPANSATAYVQNSNETSTITLMEIAQ
jgi:hypothetical protein